MSAYHFQYIQRGEAIIPGVDKLGVCLPHVLGWCLKEHNVNMKHFVDEHFNISNQWSYPRSPVCLPNIL